MGWFEDLKGNIDSIKKIIETRVESSYDKAKALKLIQDSIKIIEEIEDHDKWHDEMDSHHHGSVDD